MLRIGQMAQDVQDATKLAESLQKQASTNKNLQPQVELAKKLGKFF